MDSMRVRSSMWLVSTLLNYGELSLKDLSELWREHTRLSKGESLSRLQLNRAIAAAYKTFGVVIECDRRNKYRYHIVADENLRAVEWLVSSQAITQGVNGSVSVRNRILLEEIPSGQHHLSSIIEAMTREKALEMTYQKFADSEPYVCYVEPYCVKLANQRWYLLGCKDHRELLQVFALDRIKQLRVLFDHDFVLPSDFSPRHYFENALGVYAGPNIQPEIVTLRANLFWTNYLRTLPLHPSQQIVEQQDDYSIFSYYLGVTPDLLNRLLTFGDGIEVIEPQSLRQQLFQVISNIYNKYK